MFPAPQIDETAETARLPTGGQHNCSIFLPSPGLEGVGLWGVKSGDGFQ